MTYEDAKATYLLEHCAERCDGYRKDTTCDNCEIDMAIKAIKKQIPLPSVAKGGHIQTATGLAEQLYCANCDRRLKNDKKMAYCPRCGQAIDWRVQE